MLHWSIVLLIAIVLAVIGAVAGFLLGTRRGPGAGRVHAMQEELAQARVEHERLRGEVTTHFERTAELVNQLTGSYRELYQHLADGSQRLTTEGQAHARLEPPAAGPALMADVPPADTGEPLQQTAQAEVPPKPAPEPREPKDRPAMH
jgi:uncharacterized protein